METLAKSSLAVYYPSLNPVKERQDSLSEETGIETTVFARFRDFNDFINDKNPDYIIAPSSFEKFNNSYIPILKFFHEEELTFKYYILSLNNKWNSKNINTAKLGVVEELERTHFKNYFGDKLQIQANIIKSVSKPEDLFPLLAFNSVDIIIVSSLDYAKLKEQFTIKTIKIMESKPVSLPYIFRNSKLRSTQGISQLESLSKKTLKILGFTKLKAAIPGDRQ